MELGTGNDQIAMQEGGAGSNEEPLRHPATRESRFAEMLIAMAERDVDQAASSGRAGDRAIARWTLHELDRHLRELDIEPTLCARIGERARGLSQRLAGAGRTPERWAA